MIELWRACVLIMTNKGHLTLEGLKEIFALIYALNYGLSDALKFGFSDLPDIIRPIYTPSLIPLH